MVLAGCRGPSNLAARNGPAIQEGSLLLVVASLVSGGEHQSRLAGSAGPLSTHPSDRYVPSPRTRYRWSTINLYLVVRCRKQCPFRTALRLGNKEHPWIAADFAQQRKKPGTVRGGPMLHGLAGVGVRHGFWVHPVFAYLSVASAFSITMTSTSTKSTVKPDEPLFNGLVIHDTGVAFRASDFRSSGYLAEIALG